MGVVIIDVYCDIFDEPYWSKYTFIPHKVHYGYFIISHTLTRTHVAWQFAPYFSDILFNANYIDLYKEQPNFITYIWKKGKSSYKWSVISTRAQFSLWVAIFCHDLSSMEDGKLGKYKIYYAIMLWSQFQNVIGISLIFKEMQLICDERFEKRAEIKGPVARQPTCCGQRCRKTWWKGWWKRSRMKWAARA